jgi:oxygen-independent coproporphyrinogen III oxidase
LAGIYIHIPFCKQACHYCNFHFTTLPASKQGLPTHKNELIAALLKEIDIQRNYLQNEVVETIYFGGGTPSLLQIEDIRLQIEKIRTRFPVLDNAEITLEANPDDITEEKLEAWKQAGINRLSIGIQSFFEEDLHWMNRAHSAKQAVDSLQIAVKLFDNITVDLIYGTPALTHEKWKKNVETVLSFNIPHISCYALTVEPKTPLQKMIHQGKSENVNPDKQSEQFLLLMNWLDEAGYEHYEISNFAKFGFRSRHNSSYWSTGAAGQRKKYLGIGPSAHSFNGESRQWNIANNKKYIDSLNRNVIPFEKEVLTSSQQLNEYIMTSLRTLEGLNLNLVEKKFGKEALNRLLADSRKYITDNKILKSETGYLKLTKEGKLLADGIASDLFAL